MSAEQLGSISLPPLPYSEDGLEPYISARTLSFHYGKHHKAYVDNTINLVRGTNLEDNSLEEIIRKTATIPEQRPIFNNAAQAWNHTFFWKCMQKPSGEPPSKMVSGRLEDTFGSLDNFKTEFSKAAVKLFGSGWAWLLLDGSAIKIMPMSNADNPVAHGLKPLFTLDVWEHAYYLDYQNRRPDFVAAFLDHLINWKFLEQNLE